MLSPVPVCKYFRILTTITRLTDFQVHSVFAIFNVTDEGVHSYVYNMAMQYNNAIVWLTISRRYIPIKRLHFKKSM